MKDILVVVGNYKDREGNQKAEFLKIGALGISQSGKEYIILNPEVNIAGALFKQNLVNHSEGKPVQKNLMCSVFERQQSNNQPQQQNNQQNYQQSNAPQQNQQQNYQQPQSQPVAQQQQQPSDDSIPF